jgi:membrane associated rhomboid family serine protease
MIILPYSTALTLARRPLVSYALSAALFAMFLLQLNSRITDSMMYYPDSWNPLTMICASLIHADWMHLIGNLVFYLAFAPALEILIGSWRRYIGFMLLVSIAVGVSYSISVNIGASSNLPSLGFSGVVMGVIGLSAYLMPAARIRVFWWYYIGWKTLYAPVWLLALIYIGLDAWTMLSARDYGGINVVAHVMGGVAGYAYGLLRMRERRDETREELAGEIEAMNLQRKYGRDRAEAHRARERLQQQQQARESQLADDRFMRHLYQLVKTHRDSEAVGELLDRYHAAPVHELLPVYQHLATWDASRTLLCFGRYIIDRLDQEKRYGKALMQIEACQAMSAGFVLGDVSRTLFYAQMAIDTGKSHVAQHLLDNPRQRYAGQLNFDQCKHLLNRARKP